MVFRHSHFPRRRKRRRRRGRSAMAVAKQALRQNRPEKKILNYRDVTSTDFGWNGLIVDILPPAGITQGVNVDERIGNRCFLKSSRIRIEIGIDTDTLQNVFRFIVGYTVANVLPGVGDILSNIGDKGAPLAHYANTNSGNFQILLDRKFILSSLVNPVAMFFVHVKWNLRLNFASNAAIVPDNFRPFMLLISDEDNASTDKPGVIWHTRSYFTDA